MAKPVRVKKAVTREKMTQTGVVRHTVYSPGVHKKIVDSVKKGNSITDAGLLAGLGKDLIWSWLESGRRQPEKYPDFKRLSDDIEAARAERRGELVDRIVQTGQSGAPGTWQAAAWFLERTDPANWGRKDKVEHSGDAAPRQQINQVVIIDPEAREAARDLLKRVAGGPGANLAIGPGSGVPVEDGNGSGG